LFRNKLAVTKIGISLSRQHCNNFKNRSRANLLRFLFLCAMKNQEVINIPIRLKRAYQADKASKEVFAFAVWIKLTYGDSTLRYHSITNIQKELNIGFQKAKRLLSCASEYPELFSVAGNKITVKSFKDKTEKYNRKGQVYHSDYCQKIEVRKYSFKELYDLLYKTGAIQGLIAGKERRSIYKYIEIQSGVELTQRQISNATGYSRGYVSKLTKKMANSGVIRKYPSCFRLAMNVVNEETVSKFKKRTGRTNFIVNPHDGSAWYIMACRYSTNDRKSADSFKHVIYDQWNRITKLPGKIAGEYNQFTGVGGAYE
jgi:Uncharacterized membrane-associated protein/domain